MRYPRVVKTNLTKTLPVCMILLASHALKDFRPLPARKRKIPKTCWGLSRMRGTGTYETGSLSNCSSGIVPMSCIVASTPPRLRQTSAASGHVRNPVWNSNRRGSKAQETKPVIMKWVRIFYRLPLR